MMFQLISNWTLNPIYHRWQLPLTAPTIKRFVEQLHAIPLPQNRVNCINYYSSIQISGVGTTELTKEQDIYLAE